MTFVAVFTGNQKYHVNGSIYGNLPGFPVSVGEKGVLNSMLLNLGIHTVHINKEVSYLSIKTYVVGTQKNLLKETVLLSTQINCLA